MLVEVHWCCIVEWLWGSDGNAWVPVDCDMWEASAVGMDMVAERRAGTGTFARDCPRDCNDPARCDVSSGLGSYIPRFALFPDATPVPEVVPPTFCTTFVF